MAPSRRLSGNGPGSKPVDQEKSLHWIWNTALTCLSGARDEIVHQTPLYPPKLRFYRRTKSKVKRRRGISRSKQLVRSKVLDGEKSGNWMQFLIAHYSAQGTLDAGRYVFGYCGGDDFNLPGSMMKKRSGRVSCAEFVHRQNG